MLIEVSVRNTIGKSRAPDTIQETVSHYIGVAHGTRINTQAWGVLRQWYLRNKDKYIEKIVAVCEHETTHEPH